MRRLGPLALAISLAALATASAANAGKLRQLTGPKAPRAKVLLRASKVNYLRLHDVIERVMATNPMKGPGDVRNQDTVTLSDRIEEQEAALVRHLDDVYLGQRAALAKALAVKSSPENLYKRATELVAQIDDLAGDKSIPQIEIARGQQSGSWNTTGRSDSHGPLGASGSGEIHGSGQSSGSFSGNLPILQAAVYRVQIKSIHTRYLVGDADALTPVEARDLVGRVLELHAISRALLARDPGRAAPLQDWLAHSEIRFRHIDSGYNPRDGAATLHIDRASRDAIKLVKIGIVSQRLANVLRAETLEGPTHDHLERGSSLVSAD